MVGQMTLFDLVSEDQKEEFQIRMLMWENTQRNTSRI